MLLSSSSLSPLWPPSAVSTVPPRIHGANKTPTPSPHDSNAANAILNANGQLLVAPPPPPLPPLPPNGSTNDANSSTIMSRKPERSVVVAWSGPGGTFGGWELDDDFPFA
ncbi:hypothetical protein FRB91_002144 [Serendipita sp. 411]|nr:hypothetical protein FRB91_002144 [Serendipita sp. 411]